MASIERNNDWQTLYTETLMALLGKVLIAVQCLSPKFYQISAWTTKICFGVLSIGRIVVYIKIKLHCNIQTG